MVLTRSLQAIYSATIDRSRFREKGSQLIVFFLPFFFLGRPINLWGICLAAAGVLVRAWGAGCLYKDRDLAQFGPYRWVRHPLYLGSCLLALGLMVCLHHIVVTLILGGVTALTYFHTIRHEEGNLILRFGDRYRAFTERVGPLWPKQAGLIENFKLVRQQGFLTFLFEGFSFRQYLKNKEWECLLGVMTVFSVLFFFQ